MPLRKIADEKPPCGHPEHNPPIHMVLSPGTYEYTCPSCGHKTTFIINGVYHNIKPAATTPAFRYNNPRKIA